MLFSLIPSLLVYLQPLVFQRWSGKMPYTIYLKSTTGGDKIPVDVENDMTIAEVKAAAAERAEVPAQNQRLIYKGQVLKDDRTIESYGGRPPLRQQKVSEQLV